MDSANEPVRVRGWLSILLGTLIYAAMAWAMDLTVKQAVLTIVPLLAATIGGLEWARDVVAPMAKVRAISPPTASILEQGIKVNKDA